MGLIETLMFWRRGEVKEQQEGIKLLFNADGTLEACKVEDTSPEKWDSIFYEKYRVHELVTEDLTKRGLLDPEKNHIKLCNPQTINGSALFKIEFQGGPRPINLSFLYPFDERKSR